MPASSWQNAQDAEDACQAVFLVLARKAKSARWQPSIANWLYATARKTAANARAAALRRARREGQALVPEAVQPLDQMTSRELLTALDQELDRLPSRYREPLVLCYLEGLTRDEAARRLEIPAGTVKIQLERGRKRLGDALTRRGCGLGVGLLTLAATSVAEASPLRLTPTVVKAGLGAPSAHVLALTEGVLKAMLFTQLKIGTALVILVSALSILGASVASPYLAIAEEQGGQDQGKEKAKPKAIRTEQAKDNGSVKVATTTAESLRATYLENEALAEENLTGKTMRVTGFMDRIKRTGDQQRLAAFARQFPDRGKETTWSYDMISSRNGGPVMPGMQPSLPIIFEFGPEATTQLADLSLPLQPTIEGQCQGLVRNSDYTTLGPRRIAAIRFTNCKIVSVHNAKTHQIQSSSITATDLARVFRDNDASIDEIWADKKLKVTGTMMRVTRNELRLGGEKEKEGNFFLLVLDSRRPGLGSFYSNQFILCSRKIPGKNWLA